MAVAEITEKAQQLSLSDVETVAVDTLWGFYQKNKPSIPWTPKRIVDAASIKEREEQLVQVAEYADAAFLAYKEGSSARKRYALPICWGAAGSGKTTFGDLVLAKLASAVKNDELKAMLERRSGRCSTSTEVGRRGQKGKRKTF